MPTCDKKVESKMICTVRLFRAVNSKNGGRSSCNQEMIRYNIKTVQVNFVVDTVLYYYCVYYEIYLNSL